MTPIMKQSGNIVLAVLVSGSLACAQQKTNDPNAQAVEVLRKTMEELDKNPKVLEKARRDIEADTKAAAAAAKTQRTSLNPAPSAPAPAPQSQPLPTGTATPAQPLPTFAEMEQMYLDGKISAKDFQKYLQNMKVTQLLTNTARSPSVAATAKPPPPAVTNAPDLAPVPGPEEPKTAVTEVEKKLDELIRAQAEREKAATNAPPPTTGPKTKRQRLDDLLKQLIDGKISDEDYKTQRQKILNEPN
jgi:hypothetical protein